MSTSTVAVVPPQQLRPIPWRRLAWVTWRRQRTTILATSAVLGVLAIYLLVTGLQMRSAWHAVQACIPQQSSPCSFQWNSFKNSYANPGIISALFIFAPLLIGAFAGAPLIGRELETGTFRYAWTQGVGRVRWTIALIVAGAVAVAVMTGAFGALIAWHDRPLWDADVTARLAANEFPTTGVAIIGWSLAAYAIGVLAGLLWRRVLAALATTIGIAFALALMTSKLRPHYLAPLRTKNLDFVPGSQTIQQWWEKAGAVVSANDLNTALRSAGVQQIDVGGGGKTTPATPGDGTDPVTYLLHHGYTQWTSYQPASRYWIFQWIEFGWLTALAVLLLAATSFLVRRRDA
jgi:ABC-type transport system involved in multi-copper enzyme maturation permease subunit